MRKIQFLLLLLCSLNANAQITDTTLESEVIITTIVLPQTLSRTPAPVTYIDSNTIQRANGQSIVAALNTLPGIRMEERSPGSYRINIRGSSLRSPFGVRNVKVYYNDIPVTDPGGNTYLNQFGYYNFGSVEILRGPGNSLYGAGTGGVIRIDEKPSQQPSVELAFNAASYNAFNTAGRWSFGDSSTMQQITIQRQWGDGYREQSAYHRTNLGWTGRYKSGANLLRTTLLVSDLYYQTPGGLTITEYQNNRRAARPGSAAAAASISQKVVLAGLSYQRIISRRISNTTVVYGMFTDMRNPNLRNYSRNSEPHAGIRSTFLINGEATAGKWNIAAGGELQKSFTTITVHRNRNGVADSLLYTDDLKLRQQFAFIQASLLKNDWELLAGASFAGSGLDLQRFSNTTNRQNLDFSLQTLPRISLSRKLKNGNVYLVYSEGFSPPTLGDLLPTGSPSNLGLQPEKGANWELGARGRIKALSYDVSAFWFRLKNTIVQRRDALGGEYAINSGATAQKGVELGLRYSVCNTVDIYSSYTYHHLRYQNFVQANADYSGKTLPGSPLHTLVAGVEGRLGHWFGNATYTRLGSYFLNDANSVNVTGENLVIARLGYGFKWIELFIGVDNALDAQYFLGNDLNAVGGRYYNPAPGRSVFGGIVFRKL